MDGLILVLIGLAIIVFATLFPGLPFLLAFVLYVVGGYVTVTGLQNL